MITQQQAVAVLNQYMYGKDTNQPLELEKAFTDDAVVTFDIKPSNIYFPPEISGHKKISETMFGDFHHQFSNIKSYYLNDDFSDLQESQVTKQKWLVSMKERETGLNRLGTGSYHWLFESTPDGWKIKRAHIVIAEMLSFSHTDEKWMEGFQSHLTKYPWASLDGVVELLSQEKQLSTIVHFLEQKI